MKPAAFLQGINLGRPFCKGRRGKACFRSFSLVTPTGLSLALDGLDHGWKPPPELHFPANTGCFRIAMGLLVFVFEPDLARCREWLPRKALRRLTGVDRLHAWSDHK